MDTLTLPHINAMPAPTWHHLKVNDALVEIPQLKIACQVELHSSVKQEGKVGDFEAALQRTQNQTTEQRVADVVMCSDNASEEELEHPALSASQRRSAELEADGSFVEAFKTGMGPQAHAYLREAAGNTTVLKTGANTREQVSLHVAGVDGASNVAALDVIVGEGANFDLSISLDSPTTGTGVVGSSLRVFAGRHSKVRITCTQTLADTWLGLDDTGMFLAEGARVDVRHTVLGAQKAYTGLASDLRGERAHTTVDTRYLGHGKNLLDFNYEMRHHGPKTQSAMEANGVLAGASQKTLRGTIDFVRGCKGATGNEEETALIIDEDANNRSVPVILCGEDDVAGNHGATIGHVRPSQLFYLASRGLSPQDSEELFMRATLEEAAITAPDNASKAGVERLSKMLLANFKEEKA